MQRTMANIWTWCSHGAPETRKLSGCSLMNFHVSENVIVSDSIIIQARTYFSIQHIQSAAYFARLSAQIEKSYNGNFSDELYAHNSACVTGAVFAAVAFLEAGINEIFLDAFHKVEHGEITKLQPDTLELLARMWAHGGVDRLPTLNKYQVALALAGKQVFDSGRLPYQDVDSLIKLRNALVHYKPETGTFVSEVEAEPVTVTYLERRLRGKFTLNPLVSEANPFFPDRCLSHGCAAWAVVFSLDFADQLFLRMGLTPTYEHVRSRLNTN